MEKSRTLREVSPADIRKMTNDELNVLCDELRSFIYEKVSECGGHLASNLGAIEATVALCNVFDFTKDKIVFDVGHQCYAYKALTGRADQFDSLRKEGGHFGVSETRRKSVRFLQYGACGNVGFCGNRHCESAGSEKRGFFRDCFYRRRLV